MTDELTTVEYTVDAAMDEESGDPTELALIQYDHHLPGATEFRERILIALDRHRKQLGLISAHYYDDAIWIYSDTPFSPWQIKLIMDLASQCAAGTTAAIRVRRTRDRRTDDG